MLDRTGGNPLFVEEICRSLVEDRSLVRTTEGWQAKSNAKIAIPSTVKEVIRRRVDWIGPEAENVLAIASVFGNQFEFDLLQQLSEMKPDTLLLLVEAMLRARLLREGELGPGRSLYQFSDEQTRDVLYDGLSLVRRQRYHLKAGEALERALGHKTPERAGELAYHFLQGDDARRAIRYYVQAGDRARDMYAQREAAAGYESALRLIEQVVAPERGASAERQQGTVVAELLGDAYHYVGQHDEMLAAYRRGLELAKGCDSITLGHLWLIVAVAHSQRHEYDATLQCLDEGERALGPPPADSLSEMRPDGVAPEISLQFTPGGEGMAVRGSPSDTDRWWTEWTWVQSERMSVYYWRDEPDRMAEIIARFRPILERSARPADRAHLFGSLMLYDWRRNHGISDEGLEYARLALAAREETRDRKAIAWAKFTRGFAFFWHGDPELARPFLLTALGEGEQTEDSALVSRASTYLMVSARRAQDRAEAERLIPRVLQAAATAGHPEYRSDGPCDAIVGLLAHRRSRAGRRERAARSEDLARNPQPVPVRLDGHLAPDGDRPRSAGDSAGRRAGSGSASPVPEPAPARARQAGPRGDRFGRGGPDGRGGVHPPSCARSRTTASIHLTETLPPPYHLRP